MAQYLGLDVGTTTVTTVIIDATTRKQLACGSIPTPGHYVAEQAGRHARAELDLNELAPRVLQLISQTVGGSCVRVDSLAGVGVTGQMHGLALLNPSGHPMRPAITWQDRRVLDTQNHGASALRRLIDTAGGETAFASMESVPIAGWLGPTLFWLEEQGELPESGKACFVPDWAVSLLTGAPPVCDPTNGASSGLMRVIDGEWAWNLIDQLGLPRFLFPKVRLPGTIAGQIAPSIAQTTGLPAGLPVCVAIGDHQASFVASVARPMESIAINIGTGGQISAAFEMHASGFLQRPPGLSIRYYPATIPDGTPRYLLVGAGYVGGRTFAHLRDLFVEVLRMYGHDAPEDAYGPMVALAERIVDGSDGLVFDPSFPGPRIAPGVAASISGITPENLTPGHLTRALLEGMGRVLHGLYEQMLPTIGPRQQLVGSGNGIRRNAVLRDILSSRFQLPLQVSSLEEEGATGAALVAACGLGEITLS